MAQLLKEEQIAEYRDCFNLYDHQHNGRISCEELIKVMRSLGTCPTTTEVQNHLSAIKKKPSDYLDFAQFLTIMHNQGTNESIREEIYQALKLNDPKNTGYISASELRHALTYTGEKLTSKEVDQMFRSANVKANGRIKYKDFVEVMMVPVPDY